MSFPKINIKFKTLANSAISRLGDGVCALAFKDEGLAVGVYSYSSLTEVDVKLDAYKEFIELALLGAKKVIVVVQADIATCLKKLETEKVGYISAPKATAEEVTAIVSWVKDMRDSKEKKVKAVLANKVADYEGVINFTTEGVKVKDRETPYTALEFTARIAGLLAGTQAQDSVTFAVLSEVEDIANHLTEAEASAKINAGELILFHDGEKVKIARGVNSLTSTSGDKNDLFKKIKLVEIMDMIFEDIKRTAEDEFIGKIRNKYENKLLLCNSINAYFDDLVFEEILEKNQNKCEIDVDAIRNYLISTGVDVSNLKQAEVKAYNTGDKVFLKASITMLDAMEQIDFNINL